MCLKQMLNYYKIIKPTYCKKPYCPAQVNLRFNWAGFSGRVNHTNPDINTLVKCLAIQVFRQLKFECV